MKFVGWLIGAIVAVIVAVILGSVLYPTIGNWYYVICFLLGWTFSSIGWNIGEYYDEPTMNRR